VKPQGGKKKNILHEGDEKEGEKGDKDEEGVSSFSRKRL